MNLGRTFPSRLARRSSLAALLAACALAPSSALAASAPPGDAALSPRLAELARPALRSASRAEQAARLSLAPSGPGSLLRDGSRVLADVRLDGDAEAAVDGLRQAGAEVVHVSRRYQTVTVAAQPADLPSIADLSGVDAVTEVLTPIVRGADCGGAVRSEGDAQLNAGNARSSFGIDGSGVTVGILSDSFDRSPSAVTHAAGDVASGDLPGAGSPCGSTAAVNALDDSEAGRDEGRAMAQIVHDLAPGASIAFATAFSGELGFAANIKALAAAGAKVIADDVAYFGEPFFQDGPVAVAVNEVAATGVSYFSAAGNDNLINAAGNDIASWEAGSFRDATTCPPALAAALDAEDCMDFDPGVGSDPGFGITVAKGATLTVDLQWAEPWNGVGTDLDAFLLDSAGTPLEVENQAGESFAVGSDANNLKSQKPVEVVQWENKTGASVEVELAIDNCFGVCNPEVASHHTPRLKFALLQNGSGVTATEYPNSSQGDIVGPTVFGHSGSAATIAVGAVRYDSSSKPEAFSSRGPVKHYFGPVLGLSPAPPTGEQVIPKPDLAATDCGATTFFARLEAAVWRFCGTSAAAPHAAAVAALMRQANPGASAAQVRAELTGTAHPVGAAGADDVGAGLIDAYGAVAALALPPTITITKAPEPLSHNRRPAIEFGANRPVAFTCQVDGGPPQPCASPFGLPGLADGTHGVAVSGVDLAGRRGSSGAAMFTIDTRPPRTAIAKHPRKLIRTHRRLVRESFRFRSSEAGATFVCKVDRGLLRFCGRRYSRRFGVGRHTVQVRSRDRAGNVDRSPAVFHFRVKRVG
jgi:subtilase family protein